MIPRDLAAFLDWIGIKPLVEDNKQPPAPGWRPNYKGEEPPF